MRSQALERSLLTRIQSIRIEVAFLRGRLALAAAAAVQGNQRRDLLRRAERDARRIAREKTHWGAPQVDLLCAGVAALRGEKERATTLLERAAAGFDGAEMALHAHAARHWLGKLIGGDAGAKHAAESCAWMDAQGIVRPERIAIMLAPGLG